MKSDVRGMARAWKFVGRLAVVGVVGLVSMGCESSKDSEHEVWGTVSYLGEPVRGGVILLAPADGRDGPWGLGLIEPDGEYCVFSSLDQQPLTPGRYTVSFRLPPSPTSEIGTAPKDSKIQIPEKYLDREKPLLSVQLSSLPAEVDITLRD